MNVYFTVDTESSMAGAWRDPELRPLSSDRHIFCRIGRDDYGIGLISDALGEYGFRATHFVEPLVTLVNGDDDTRAVFDFLLERKQDVQLHIHPTYRLFADTLKARATDRSYEPPSTCDLLGSFDESMQLELIEQAAGLHQKLTGARPVAFRAGCFAANRHTLRCLHQAGLLLDTSFNPCYPEWSFPGEGLKPNQVRKIEGVWELPVSVARTPIPEGYGGLKHADPCALSFGELRVMLERGVELGQKHFVLVFHSFSAVKARDDQYRQIRPDRVTIRRLRRLMKYLSDYPKLYNVTTFGDLARDTTSLDTAEASLADLPVVKAGLRKSVQAVNRCYWF